jgi:phage terminase Nu1 subunit (DNA packaging protein)
MNKKELADVLGLKPRQIDNLVIEGLPRVKDGRAIVYGVEAVAWYFRRKLEAAVERAPSLDDARARKENALAELAEYQLDQVRAQMVDQETRVRELARILDRIRAVLLNVPGRDAPGLIGLRSYGEARVALEKIIDRVLQALTQSADEIEGEDGEEPEAKPARKPRKPRPVASGTGDTTRRKR